MRGKQSTMGVVNSKVNPSGRPDILGYHEQYCYDCLRQHIEQILMHNSSNETRTDKRCSRQSNPTTHLQAGNINRINWMSRNSIQDKQINLEKHILTS